MKHFIKGGLLCSWLLLSSLLVASGCATGRGRSGPEVLLVIDDGTNPEMPELSLDQRRQVAERIEAQLERHLGREGHRAVVVDGGEGRRGYVLTVHLRRYTPGNAAARVLGRLFGTNRPGPEDAATVRASYQLRDGEGRLVRVNAMTTSSRRSWEEAVDEVCLQTAREVARALTEARSSPDQG